MQPDTIQLGAKSRSQALRERLTMQARQLGAGAKLPKVTDLCRDFSVSPTTLNGVLRELENDGLLVRRHAVGIFVAADAPVAPHRALICHPRFFHNDGNSPLWQYLFTGIYRRAATLPGTFDCHFSRSGSGEEALPPGLAEEIRRGSFTGLLGIAIPGDTAWWIMNQGVPLVSLFGKGHVIVNTDGAREVLLAVQELKKRGCRRIGMWGRVWPHHDAQAEEREIAGRADLFRSAMRQCALRVQENLIHINPQWVGGDAVPTLPEQGYEMAMRVFARRGAKPDGLWILDENVTRGALMALRKLGIRPGHDVQIASQVNKGLQVLWGHEEELILLEYDPAQFVEMMFNSLDDLLNGRLPLVEDQFATIQPQVQLPQ
jgi:hypothetical protein